jgi:hypothetical protein
MLGDRGRIPLLLLDGARAVKALLRQTTSLNRPPAGDRPASATWAREGGDGDPRRGRWTGQYKTGKADFCFLLTGRLSPVVVLVVVAVCVSG